MKSFVVYHSTERMGYKLMPSLKGAGFLSNKGLSFLKRVLGEKVWMITGTKGADRKNRYHLVGYYIADEVTDSDNPAFDYYVSGKEVRWLKKPVELNEFDWFWVLFKSQGSFAFGLSQIKDKDTVTALEKLMRKCETESRLAGG